MKLSELKDFMLVKTRNGDWHTVVNAEGRMYDISNGTFVVMSSYDEDMNDIYGETRWDIMEVHSFEDAGDVISFILGNKGIEAAEQLWKRQDNSKVAEVETLIATLTGQLENARVELEKIKGGN